MLLEALMLQKFQIQASMKNLMAPLQNSLIGEEDLLTCKTRFGLKLYYQRKENKTN
jgi:hypothetical protein